MKICFLWVAFYIMMILLVVYLWKNRPLPEKVGLPEGPRLAIQTYLNKAIIPEKVHEAWKRYGYNYERKVYDDDDVRAFLRAYYPEYVVKKFDEIPSGAHKADLFRYCILYVQGGVYADIKTELIQDVDKIIPDRSKMYLVLSEISPGTVYNGFLYSPPGNPILYDLILQAVSTPIEELQQDYFAFIRYMYDIIRSKYLLDSNFVAGLNPTIDGVPDIIAYREVAKKEEECHDGLDRYGFCSWIVDKSGKNIVKTRYSDYPWHTPK